MCFDELGDIELFLELLLVVTRFEGSGTEYESLHVPKDLDYQGPIGGGVSDHM
jgi:hypothetical protein